MTNHSKLIQYTDTILTDYAFIKDRRKETDTDCAVTFHVSHHMRQMNDFFL